MPFGAHVALTEGRRLNPLSSWKQIQALRRRAFFYPGPLLLHPVGDGLVVALDGPARRALAAPAHLAQDPPHVPGVIGDTGDGLDNLGDALERPHVGRVAVVQRPLLQLFLDVEQISLVELGKPARPPCGAQCSGSSSTPVGMPPAHTLARHLELARDIRLAHALTKQLSGSFAPSLHGTEIARGARVDRHHDQREQRMDEEHADSLSRWHTPVTVLCEPL